MQNLILAYLDFSRAGKEASLWNCKRKTKEIGPFEHRVEVAAACLHGGGIRHHCRRRDGGDELPRRPYGRRGESIPQTSTVKVTAKAEDSDAVVAVAREALPSVVTISTMSVEEMRSFFGGTQESRCRAPAPG